MATVHLTAYMERCNKMTPVQCTGKLVLVTSSMLSCFKYSGFMTTSQSSPIKGEVQKIVGN